MKSHGIQYEFITTLWRHSVAGGWFFLSLPKKCSKEIRAGLKHEEEGWGRLKAVASIGTSEWQTAIWFDRKMNTYLLPIKAFIRKKENLVESAKVKITLWI